MSTAIVIVVVVAVLAIIIFVSRVNKGMKNDEIKRGDQVIVRRYLSSFIASSEIKKMVRVGYRVSSQSKAEVLGQKDGVLVTFERTAAWSPPKSKPKSAPTPTQASKLKEGESLTPGGYVRRADGVVMVPTETKRLVDAWAAAGSIAGLSMAEIVHLVGVNADPVPAVRHTNGYSHTWSQPGYRIGVLFGPDNRAIGIIKGSEQLG